MVKYFTCLLFLMISSHLMAVKITTEKMVYENARLKASAKSDSVTVVMKESEQEIKLNSVMPLNLTLKNGKIYTNAKIDKLTGNYVYISHESGMARIDLNDLSRESKDCFVITEDAGEKQAKTEMESAVNFLKKIQDAKKEYETNQNRVTDIGADNNLGADNNVDTDRNTVNNRKVINNRKVANSNIRYKPRVDNSEFYSSVFTVIGDYSSGTCFCVNLYGIKLLISNAHVIVTNKNIVVRDNRNRKIEINNILISKSLDMVIFEGKIPENIKPLDLEYEVSRLRPDAGIYSLGNSLGEQIIVHSQGKVLGIGPEKVEIDADVVPGNSGGPVISNESKKVIGVASYLKVARTDTWTQGTRFDSVVRRFALRIDTISLEDFEPASPFLLQNDINIYHEIDTAYGSILSCPSYNNFLEKCIAFYHLTNKYLNHKWSNCYIAEQYKEKQIFANKIGAILNVKPKLSSEAETKFVKTEKCPNCANGYVQDRVVNSGYGGKKLVTKYTTVTVKCSNCHGSGFVRSNSN